MRIRQKLILEYLIVAVLIAIVGYFGINAAVTFDNEFDKIAQETIPIIETLEDLKYAGLRVVSSTNEFGFIKAEKKAGAQIQEEKEEELLESGKVLYSNAFKRYEDLVNKYFPKEKEFLNNIKSAGQELFKTSNEIIGIKTLGVSGLEVLNLKNKFEKEEMVFLNTVNKVLAYQNSEFAERKKNVEIATSNSIAMIMIISIFTFSIAIGMGAFISRSILNPILKLKDLTLEISEGKLNTSIEIKSKDEIGLLATCFNQMTKNLQKSRNEIILAKQYTENIIFSMRDALIILDQKGIIHTINQTLLTLLGYQEHELLKSDFGALIAKESSLSTSLQVLIEKGESPNINVCFHTKDGRKVPMSLVASAMRDEQGRLYRIIVIARDMTDNNLIEELRIAKASSEAINQTLRDAIKVNETQNWLKTGETQLNNQMQGVSSIEELTRRVVSFLAAYINAYVGLLFIMDGEVLKLTASYAFKNQSNKNSFGLGEGLVGQSAKEKKTIVFDHVPEDHFNITIHSGLGKSKPQSIVFIPLLYEDDVKGVMSFGACREFSDNYIEFLEGVSNAIAINIHMAQANKEMVMLLANTQQQFEKLRTQQEELRALNDELEERR